MSTKNAFLDELRRGAIANLQRMGMSEEEASDFLDRDGDIEDAMRDPHATVAAVHPVFRLMNPPPRLLWFRQHIAAAPSSGHP